MHRGFIIENYTVMYKTLSHICWKHAYPVFYCNTILKKIYDSAQHTQARLPTIFNPKIKITIVSSFNVCISINDVFENVFQIISF